jgi:PAS domain-containing protein
VVKNEPVKRRSDRNLREQQRSQKITQQITELRSVLAAANVHFKPDKHSTLVSVVDYIKQLQRRSSLLNAEHQKLISTIAKTGEVVNANKNNGDSVSTSSASQSISSSNSSSKNSSSDQDADDHLVFVKGLDYKSIFNCCGIALGIASVDGRFLDCNDQFLSISGYCRDELLTVGSASNNTNEMHLMEFAPRASNPGNVPSIISKKNLSLFSLLDREDMERVFSIMSQMLKSLANEHKESYKPGKSTIIQNHSDVNADQWSGLVRLSRRKESPVRYLAFHSYLL